MPSISKIRFTNLIYEDGAKRYKDDTFQFDGHNGAILLENGGGKTVFVQAAIQAVLPHANLAERKARDTFSLENSSAHIAIEWVLNERPRRYALTAVTLFGGKDGLNSYKYVYEYSEGDDHSLDRLPFVRKGNDGKLRSAGKEEMYDYYQYMSQKYLNAHFFQKTGEYQDYIEENFKIIASEWRKISLINSTEGGVENFFDGCKTTSQLVDRLLIPAVEEVLAGNGPRDFAEIFEKQREHFKKHRQLRERIAESKRVEEKISRYVTVFSAYHQAEQQLLSLKKEVKAVYQLAATQKESVDLNQRENANAQESLRQNQLEWTRKEASYELAVLKQKVDQAESIFVRNKEEHDSQQEEYDFRNRRLQNLEIARLKAKVRESRDQIAYYQEQLRNLEADVDILELEQKLKTNTAGLKFCFQQEESRLETEIQGLEAQFNEWRKLVQEIEEKRQQQEAENSRRLQIKAGLDKQIEIAETDMRQIARQLLENPLGDDLEQEKGKWEKRLAQLEKTKLDHGQQIRQLEEERKLLAQELPNRRQELDQARAQEITLNHQLTGIEETHANLLQQLAERTGELTRIDSLYLKQATILERLEGGVEKLRAQRERLLFLERQALRLYDLYQPSTYYTADPQLEKWIRDWQPQFQYLEAGTVYIQKAAQHLGRDEREFYQAYSFWVISVICLESEADKLVKRLAGQADELSHPVFVLTSEEARAIIDRDAEASVHLAPSLRQVFPSAWSINLVQSNFAHWKQDIEQVGKDASRERKIKEVELDNLNELLKNIREFLDKYPYEEFRQIQAEKKELQGYIFTLTRTLSAKENRYEEAGQQVLQYQKSLTELEQEHAIFSNKILQAHSYLKKKIDRQQALREKRHCEELIKGHEEEIERIIKQQARTVEKRDRIKEDLNGKLQAIKQLRNEPLYLEVKDEVPLASSRTRKMLETERQDILDILNEKQQGRREIEILLAGAKKEKDDSEKGLSRKRQQCDYAIDEDLLFPPQGNEEIDRLISETNKLKKRLDEAKKTFRQAEKDFVIQKAKFEDREKKFYKNFEQMAIFTQPLPEVAEKLNQEKAHLKQQEEYLTTREKHLMAEQKDIQDVLIQLERKNEVYGFLSEQLEAAELLGSISQDFPYQRMKIVSDYIAKLEKHQDQVQQHDQKVNQEKQQFSIYCQDNVQDVKLKEMVQTGIRYKGTYEEILDWQTRMSERILRSIRIAEEDMREHDRELQQFINYLHTYLVTLADELRLLPRKTRVKVGGGWKEIFSFDVPEWEEREGKEELRQHIDWMIRELESSKYRDEQGNENNTLMKNDLEKWLQSQQLLRQVMKQKMIKVKCRKVTVDGKVSGFPTSWESSNLWSGGEKWSKNMALFLGILNYLAEKRQAINPRAKRYRTVIMDNPFGKASSDHVLNPVFFIAEQLGFQMIALTALGEGKFIRDYFPIVYSCRLRSATDEDKYIMTNEKEIRHAFFKDHDPIALSRLGDHEQTVLF